MLIALGLFQRERA